MNNKAFRWVVIVILLAMIGYLTYLLTAEPKKQMDVMMPAADFSLENVDGRTVTLADTAGKAKIVYFYYSTCPDVCLPTTYTLSKIQDKLKEKDVFGTDVNLVSITFDPERDTKERLQEFAKLNNADLSGWYFLRGEDEATMAKLAEEYGVMVIKDKGGETFTHSNWLLLVDGKGDIRNYYRGDDPDLDLDEIVSDLIQLSKE